MEVRQRRVRRHPQAPKPKNPPHSREWQESPKSKPSPFPPPFPFPRKRESPDSSAIGANYKPKRRERCPPRLSKQGDSRFRGNGRGESAGIKWKCANEESADIPKPPKQKPSPFPRMSGISQINNIPIPAPLSIPAKAGISRFQRHRRKLQTEAARALLAPPQQTGRFPLSREWKR